MRYKKEIVSVIAILLLMYVTSEKNMNVVIDIETIPDQTKGAIDLIAENLTVKAPDLNKGPLLESLGYTAKGDMKYKTVPELKEMWLEEFGLNALRDQAEAKWLKTSLDGTYGEIIAISIDVEGEAINFTNEGDILHDLSHELIHACAGRMPYFIAHNAKFDLPFLYKRYVINGLNPGFDFSPHGRHGSDHYCTSEAWAGFGNRISLKNLASALGVGSKTEGMDGSQVWPEFQKGNIKKISSYCADDVALTKKVYEKLTFEN